MTSLFLHTSDCYECTCEPVKNASSVKYLGLLFDCDLLWNLQLSHLCNRLRAVSCLLYNMRCLMPIFVRKIIVHALVYSVLRYGLTLYGHSTLRWSWRIYSILHSLLSVMAHDFCPRKDADVFKLVNLPTSLIVESVVIKHFCNNDFKIRYTNVYRINTCA